MFLQKFFFIKKLSYHIQYDSYCFLWGCHPDSNWGIKVLQTLALPLGDGTKYGAENETRTRDPHLGKVMLYQLSYFRIMATRRGLEPLTSAVTGRHSNQLNYRAAVYIAFDDDNYYKGYIYLCQQDN